MKSVAIIPFLIGIILFRTTSSEEEVDSGNRNVFRNDTIPTAQVLKKFIPDDYSISDSLIYANSYNRTSGEIVDPEGSWFINDKIKEIIVFILYTDYYHNIIYHFRQNDVPKTLIKRMELQTKGGLASETMKQKYFKGFFNAAKPLQLKFFKTNKGFRLGDLKEKVIMVYGKPDKISKENNLEIYEWDYIGDTFFDPKKDKGKKIAKNSYGHQAIIFFRNNKLIGLILHNDIP